MNLCLPPMQDWGSPFAAMPAAAQITFSVDVAAYGVLQPDSARAMASWCRPHSPERLRGAGTLVIVAGVIELMQQVVGPPSAYRMGWVPHDDATPNTCRVVAGPHDDATPNTCRVVAGPHNDVMPNTCRVVAVPHNDVTPLALLRMALAPAPFITPRLLARGRVLHGEFVWRSTSGNGLWNTEMPCPRASEGCNAVG
jgi:hypothetical protein